MENWRKVEIWRRNKKFSDVLEKILEKSGIVGDNWIEVENIVSYFMCFFIM